MSDPSSSENRWEAPCFPDAGDTMPTAGELEQLQQQAYDEAYAEAYKEGLARGEAKGLAAGENEVAARLLLLNQMVSQLRAPLTELDEVLESQLLQMVLAMVGRLFRRQLDLDPGAIKGLVRDAVALLPVASNRIEVHVHPDDAERLEAIAPGADEQGDEEPVRWIVVRDAALTRGGCRIKSDSSHVDATVESRIDTMINTLIGDQRT